jgi:hypothetical protein
VAKHHIRWQLFILRHRKHWQMVMAIAATAYTRFNYLSKTALEKLHEVLVLPHEA